MILKPNVLTGPGDSIEFLDNTVGPLDFHTRKEKAVATLEPENMCFLYFFTAL